MRLTVAAGLRPMIDIAFWAPRWAIRGQAGDTTRLRTEIDPGEYARFAQAVARRYAGGYVPANPPASPPAASPSRPDATLLDGLLGRSRSQPLAQVPTLPPPALPAVDLFTIWNEPNHPGFLLPQWRREGGRYVPSSPHLYRAMVRASYPAIKRGAPASRVLIGGTASMGSSTPGKSGVTPLLFLREFACVDKRLLPFARGSARTSSPSPVTAGRITPTRCTPFPTRSPRTSTSSPSRPRHAW